MSTHQDPVYQNLNQDTQENFTRSSKKDLPYTKYRILQDLHRRKFRSQTSHYGQMKKQRREESEKRREEKKKEDQRRERFRRKKMQARKK
jgi:hypothetical protein